MWGTMESLCEFAVVAESTATGVVHVQAPDGKGIADAVLRVPGSNTRGSGVLPLLWGLFY